MKTIIELISDKLKGAFTECGYEERFGMVTVSNRPDLCQFQCNGALAAAKQYKKAPIVIAGEICEKVKSDAMFEEIIAVAPGFLNIKISQKALEDYVQEMAVSDKFGYEPTGEGKTVIIDYGGANVAKPLHIGHLRTAIIGESVKKILNYGGYQAIGDVHLGDWGLQMGLIITEVKKRNPELPYFDESFEGEYPKEAPFNIAELEKIYPFASAYSKEHADYLADAHQATAELQNGRRGYVALWQHILEVSIKDLKKNYDRLKVSFELWKKESDANKYIPEVIEDMKKNGFTRISDGALVVDVKEDSDTKEMPPCILLKSDGAALYASTDIATLYEREKLFQPKRVLYVVDKRQALHFEQVFRTVKKTGIVRPETELIFMGFGTMNGSNGKPFKTRDGGAYRLEYLMDDIYKEVYTKTLANREMDEEEASEISAIIGLAALKYGDLSNQAAKDYIFDIERFTSFEGNTGPYILYTMVRIKAILNKYAEMKLIPVSALLRDMSEGKLRICTEGATSRKRSLSEMNLLLSLSGYQEMIIHAVDEMAPHRICQYIYELSNLFNSFYHENRILTEENEQLQGEWMALITLVLSVLNEATALLGIEAPERM